jgi:hypothetical protein
MIKRIVLLLSSCLIASQVYAQPDTMATAKRSEYVKTLPSLLTGNVPAATLEKVSKKADTWKRTKSDKDWIEFTDAVHNAAATSATKYEAATSATKYEVEISTSGGKGASVKYQTLGERVRGSQPTTAKGLTTLKEQIFIGMYHIWSERQGRATSKIDAQYAIDGFNPKFELEEIK